MTTEPTTRAAVYRNHVEGFGTVSIVPVDPDADAAVIHRWVGQDRARFWGMGEADLDRVREIYSYLDSLTTHHAYLVQRDGTPAALFQTYEPEADPVGECYDVQPGDFGVHLMIGPADGEPQPGYTAVLLGEFVAWVLSEPGRLRIVAEPDARNTKALDRLVRTGFELGPEIDLEGKRARLAFLRREVALAGR
ncbi:GNAT family N-acetyltransferase [Streptomyces sp. 549]|uniref:GNAT family N-acetyltransferase n=1 Tax=Streptomyces sp. 549 TaxID=3049076 RepID=UPI0024C23154|nr:GNAT family N-acetyltransferase [Streptomyces sp. 549]MDK1472105.1 GNAT family N-acetyltransferase [Streptomyces sp. 549]